MSLSAHLIEQLDAEIDASRRVIERIPESAMEWSPHEKSWNTRELATHIANLVSWGAMIGTTEELDFESEEMKSWKPPKRNYLTKAHPTFSRFSSENGPLLMHKLNGLKRPKIFLFP